MPDWSELLFGEPAAPGATSPPGRVSSGQAGALPGAARLTPAPSPSPGAGFRQKAAEVARRLRMDPQHLLAVMSFETGGTFDPAVRNQAGSGAMGLIQFLPSTARALGTTTEALAQMTPEAQLDYVERYLKPYSGRMRTLQDAYMAVLYPAAVGKPASHVLFTQGTRAYGLNKGLDPQQTGTVTVGDAVRAVTRHLGSPAVPPAAPAAPQQVDWAGALGLSAPEAPPQVDWRAVLQSPQAPVQAPDVVPGGVQTDWGQALFGTPGR